MFVSIVVTVVSGKQSVRRCLESLCAQVNPSEAEIIVPYDVWSEEVGELSDEFPDVCFHFMNDSGAVAQNHLVPRKHHLYDHRRAVGLALARGCVIAMTEDHALPAADWYSQILKVHEQPFGVIGGLIDNAVDRPLNWALYYCDFVRYGSPLSSRETKYISDVNVSYKRHALESIRGVWCDAYHETTAHWALKSRGEVLFLDSRLKVYQHRPKINFGMAYRERIEWGRTFAETRVAVCSGWRRILFAVGTPFLPGLLLLRILRHMLRQKRTISHFARNLPIAWCLLTGWALGELAGYLLGTPREIE